MKLILQFIKPHWKLLAITLLLLIIDIACALLIPTFAGDMLNQGAAGNTFQTLMNTGVKMLVFSLLAGIAAILGGYTCSILTAKVARDIRNEFYKKTLDLSISDFRTFGTASITTRTVSDVTNIQTALLSTIQMVLPVPFIFILSLVLAFRRDTMMGCILLAVLAVIFIIALVIMKSASPLFKKLQKLLDKMSTVLLENITGVRVVRAFNKEEKEEQRMDCAFSDYAMVSIKTNRMFACLDGISMFAINIFIIIVYYLSGWRITAGHFNIGHITSIIEYAMLALFYLMMAQMIILTLPRAMECSNRIKEILDFSPEIKDIVTIDNNDLIHGKEILKFENVSFKFIHAEEYTLKNLNFVCNRGETTAIIGGTGSGKSAIASLMLRFNEVSDGTVYFDGVDLRQMPQRQLRESISYVQQKAWLFAGTIADNLRFGNEAATDEELWHALEVAQAAEFVKSLPDGLQSFVAQGGTNFSGGQKQRLSIARALVKKTELYIFDDSFSALDFKTDAALRKALADETKDAAVIIIAQRVSSIRHANQIIVLHEGEPVGIGTHEWLINNCSVYREIYDSQTKETQDE